MDSRTGSSGVPEGTIVAMLVLLVPAEGRDVSVGSVQAGRLADLGITDVSLLRDRDTVAVVLEGWAFDPARSAGRAVELVIGSAPHAQALHAVAHVSVSAMTEARGEKGGARCGGA